MNNTLHQAPTLPPHFRVYLGKAGKDNVPEALHDALERTIALFGAVDESRGGHRYAEGKWSIKEVLQHLNDCERIFAYRALCFARNDSTVLPGFDEDLYAATSAADRIPLATILNEHRVIRQATLALFTSFDEAMLQRSGRAGSSTLSVRDLGLIIAGHAQHHCDIHEQRYL
ncbi:MAG: DinB family protein [Flavobacteriales bacterium]|nr:DinB family protein [Flavobacteriales bacterium]